MKTELAKLLDTHSAIIRHHEKATYPCTCDPDVGAMPCEECALKNLMRDLSRHLTEYERIKANDGKPWPGIASVILKVAQRQSTFSAADIENEVKVCYDRTVERSAVTKELWRQRGLQTIRVVRKGAGKRAAIFARASCSSGTAGFSKYDHTPPATGGVLSKEAIEQFERLNK